MERLAPVPPKLIMRETSGERRDSNNGIRSQLHLLFGDPPISLFFVFVLGFSSSHIQARGKGISSIGGSLSLTNSSSFGLVSYQYQISQK